MKLILKYKDRIVSFGLLPIIITLIGLHFFPTMITLGTGLAISLIGLLYNIIRLKELNFFLLQGTIGIGICFFLRLFTGYQYVPLKGITPSLELFLLAVAFIHVTVPEIYKSFLKLLRCKTCFSYTLETKLIVILSGIHLIALGIMEYNGKLTVPENHFIMLNIIPVLIYILCLIVNIIGIRIAATEEVCKHDIIRIAPICNGKIYLIPYNKTKSGTIWDLPVKENYEEIPSRLEKRVIKIARQTLPNIIEKPRLILRYKKPCHTDTTIHLYILPLQEEKDITISNGSFFSIEDIKSTLPHSKTLAAEMDQLKMAADVWNLFK